MYKQFNFLPDDAKEIREAVFMKEQHFEDEFDEIDEYATHVVFYDQSVPYATCRFFKEKPGTEYVIGRIAVIKAYRGKHLGSHIVTTAEQLVKEQGGTKLSLSAQVRVQPFYEKLGFAPMGEVYLDEYCEHIHMEKSL